MVAVRRIEHAKPVFNITVTNTPEYFAAGVLVHNCDAARYLCRLIDGPDAPGESFYDVPSMTPFDHFRPGTF